MSTHTPGPWSVFSGTNEVRADNCKWGNNWPVADALGHDLDEIEANARLIAAAPELLEEIECVNVKLPYGILEQVRSAISKAKGSAE